LEVLFARGNFNEARQGKINQEATQTIQLSQRSIGRKDI
jgi:hypothetical protein